MLFYQVLSAYYVTKIVGNERRYVNTKLVTAPLMVKFHNRRQMLMLDGKTIPELDDYFRYARDTFEYIGCT